MGLPNLKNSYSAQGPKSRKPMEEAVCIILDGQLIFRIIYGTHTVCFDLWKIYFSPLYNILVMFATKNQFPISHVKVGMNTTLLKRE